ncbi:MAG TPA: hypothetical protein VJ998_06125 [Pseudomonadales bacterium]|nr:hypothetical protein [Pseudomonadales bacterium]
MSEHFFYGFVLATLLAQLWGQFPSGGQRLRLMAAIATGRPTLA